MELLPCDCARRGSHGYHHNDHDGNDAHKNEHDAPVGHDGLEDALEHFRNTLLCGMRRLVASSRPAAAASLIPAVNFERLGSLARTRAWTLTLI